MVIVLGVVVAVVAVIALREPNGHVSSAGSKVDTPRTTPAASQSSSRAAPKSSTPATHSSSPSSGASSTSAGALKSVPLVVLNNTTTEGLAAEAAQRFRDGGWTVTTYGNYQNDILSTCAYYDPSVPNAQAAAQALQTQFPTIKRIEPQFSELSSYNSPIVVILTPDYSA